MTDSLFGVPPPRDDVLTATGTVPTPPNFMPMPKQAEGSWLPEQYAWSMNLAWVGPESPPGTSPYFRDFPLNTGPQLLTPTSVSGEHGTAGSTTLKATGGPSPFTFTAQGSLPTGITLNSTTGVLAWTSSAAAGEHTITVTPKDANGSEGAPITITLTLEEE